MQPFVLQFTMKMFYIGFMQVLIVIVLEIEHLLVVVQNNKKMPGTGIKEIKIKHRLFCKT
jgi:hypothetical protein